MSKHDPFSSARLLIGGAKEDIKRLDAAFDAYFQSKPYTEGPEVDLNRSVDVYKLKMVKPVPPLLSRDVARIATELRSALDQAGYATAVASGNTRLKNTYFPFAPDTTQLDNVMKGRCKDIPNQIVTLFRSFNAHRGGDDMLWALNEIANTIKHRVIVPVGRNVGKIIVENFNAATGAIDVPKMFRWDSAKDEMVICTVSHGSGVKYKINLGFYIAFGDIEVVRGMHVWLRRRWKT